MDKKDIINPSKNETTKCDRERGLKHERRSNLENEEWSVAVRNYYGSGNGFDRLWRI